ncbi:hypothetical protein [Aeromicrobium sp. Root472D3]|uniref:hypothetical protein n=1 Tax=Aeromicrobium sp. Root472D3 TaxID=1736540 RepID=UPI000B238D9F|nr:hypothetical protein [Aeromicrobium sp. Root472D3]
MSNLIHCDGANCAKTKAVRDEPRLCAPGWLMLEQPSHADLDLERDPHLIRGEH